MAQTMKSELQSMYDNQVWTLIDSSNNLKTIGCKWVFNKKTDMDGNVHTYKARLVAKGDRKSTRLNSSHLRTSRMPSSA